MLFLWLARFFFLLLIFSLGYMQPFLFVAGFRVPPTDLIFLFVCFFFLLALLTKQTGFRRHEFFWLLIFYFSAMLFSLVFSVNLQTSVIKLGGEIYLLCLPVLAFNLIESENDMRLALRAWLGGTAVAAAVGILTVLLFYVDRENFLLRFTLFHYGAVPVGNYPRVAATFLSASLLCNYLSVSLILLFIARRSGWVSRRLFYPLTAAIASVAAFTIASNLGGIALAAGWWFYFIFRDKQKALSILSLLAGIFTAGIFYAMNFVALARHRTASFSFSIFGYEFSPSPRLMIWIESLKTFRENFFFGRGVGQDACRVAFENTDGSISILTDAHNIFLSVAAQEGIFGLLAISAIVLYLLRKAYGRTPAETGAAILRPGFGIAFFSAFVYQGLTGSFEDARHLWVLVGLLLASENFSEAAEKKV